MKIKPWDGDEFLDAPTVVSFDMGGMTGWSAWEVHPEALTDPTVKILDNVEHHTWGEIDSRGPDAEVSCAKEALEIVRGFPGCAVLMEDFILQMYSKGRDLLTPVRLNAMLDFALEVNLGVTVTHRQMASEAKATVTDARLKLWGFYTSAGGQEHARDADRHAILFLRKAKDPKRGALRRAAWWPHIYGIGAPYYIAPKNDLAGQTVILQNDKGKDPEYLAGLMPTFKAPMARGGKIGSVRNTRRTG